MRCGDTQFLGLTLCTIGALLMKAEDGDDGRRLYAALNGTSSIEIDAVQAMQIPVSCGLDRQCEDLVEWQPSSLIVLKPRPA